MADLKADDFDLNGNWDHSGGSINFPGVTDMRFSLTAGITADTNQDQTNATALTSTVNQVSTCAVAGDAVKLPVATASQAQLCVIINNGVASMGVFPASGDDIGAGVDTELATELAVGDALVCWSYDATNWFCNRWTPTS